MQQPAIFLDRDGTIIRDVGFAHRRDDLHFVDGAIAGLQRMVALGYALVITTNQSGIARGYFSETDMHEFNRALCQSLEAAHAPIAAVYYCPFHPTEGSGIYRRDSELRKPRPGMILQAAAEHQLDLARSYAIGDRLTDILAGRTAGCRTILVRGGASETCASGSDVLPDHVADDLLDAARFIECHDRRGTIFTLPERTEKIPLGRLRNMR